MKKSSPQSPLYPILFFLSLALLTVILLAGCEMRSLTDGWHDAGIVLDETPSATTSPPTGVGTTAPPQATTAPPVTTAPTQYYHPLSGLPCRLEEATSRPIAFCVKSAAPSEIRAADFVIEAATEGAATRLSLIGTAHTELYDTLSISSIRPYLATVTNDFFGISIFRGTTDNAFSATDFLFNTFDLEEETPNGAAALLSALSERGYQTALSGSILLPYRLAAQNETVTPDTLRSSYVSVPFHDNTATTFTYDAIRKAYTMRGGAALLNNGEDLPTFKNLLILFHDATKRVTKDGTLLELNTSFGGQGYYLTEGGAIPILWQRDPVTSSLRLHDADGTELTINRGKTYLAMTTYEYRDFLIMN